MSSSNKITVAYGDGIGPEIMKATLKILDAAGANLEYEVIEIGEKVYTSGIDCGIPTPAWDILKKNKVLLKAPITTPQGGGYKSLNVTIRKTLGLFANVRPNVSYYPYVKTNFPDYDIVIIRENEEDLYAGIEYRLTSQAVESVKLVSVKGSEKIIRYAFEYAKAYNRKKVTCMSKDNIMKLTDGMFHQVFDEVAKDYPEIESNHQIVDIGSANVAARPEQFDVIVTTNLYGDIISDIAAQVAGSVGMAGSVNAGLDFAMFEAIHGSAPDIAGKGIANPSGLLNGAIMMLVHLGKAEIAEKIKNAWLKTLEDGIHTGDIFQESISKQRVGTQEFADAVIKRLGQKPTTMPAVEFNKDFQGIKIDLSVTTKSQKELVGVDVFIEWDGSDTKELADKVKAIDAGDFELKLLGSRGVKVYPSDIEVKIHSDFWRCRFMKKSGTVDNSSIVNLLSVLSENGIQFVQVQNLYDFEGERYYSLCQGE